MFQTKNEAAFKLNVASREEILALEKLVNIKHTTCQLSSLLIDLLFFYTIPSMKWR